MIQILIVGEIMSNFKIKLNKLKKKFLEMAKLEMVQQQIKMFQLQLINQIKLLYLEITFTKFIQEKNILVLCMIHH
jgi:hypothetical protein